MLEQLLKLYTMAMATGVTSPMPHFVGPPGSGKSTVFQQLAEVLGVKLHVVNVSRISPLGLEGLEMPNKENTSLQLLISELWTKSSEGDIYLFDEFLRGFPEVYNGLLDIFTSREVAGFKLNKVFIAGASNSTATYDTALEDRLLHLKVPDPRRSRAERERLAGIIVEALGLMPEMAQSAEMVELLDKEVLPTFSMLDQFGDKPKRSDAQTTSATGTSVRKLIGQALLREVQSIKLVDLISENNSRAYAASKLQYVFLLEGKTVRPNYKPWAESVMSSDKLTELQRTNLSLNMQLIDIEEFKIEQREGTNE